MLHPFFEFKLSKHGNPLLVHICNPLTFVSVSLQIAEMTVSKCLLYFTCGVVTRIAPSGLYVFRFSMALMCSSDVPGGVSMMR